MSGEFVLTNSILFDVAVAVAGVGRVLVPALQHHLRRAHTRGIRLRLRHLHQQIRSHLQTGARSVIMLDKIMFIQHVTETAGLQ